MEAGSSKMYVTTYQTTWSYNPRRPQYKSSSPEKLKSHQYTILRVTVLASHPM